MPSNGETSSEGSGERPAGRSTWSRGRFLNTWSRDKSSGLCRPSEIGSCKRLGDDATPQQIREAVQRAWDSVDNRMGQLVYDNLFWNRAVKDLAMASVRSVGWNLGSVREMGGGVKTRSLYRCEFVGLKGRQGGRADRNSPNGLRRSSANVPRRSSAQ
jgi:hypothetical protein